MFRKPKIDKIVGIHKGYRKKVELRDATCNTAILTEPDDLKLLENIDAIIEHKNSPDVEALINTQLKETGKIYQSSDGRRYKYILATGIRKSKDGTIVPYSYKKIYYIRDTTGLKRGPKKGENKILLRKLLVKLKDNDCAKILNYISNNIRKVSNGCETDNKEQNPIQAVL